MAQLITYLVHKHEDLSWISNNYKELPMNHSTTPHNSLNIGGDELLPAQSLHTYTLAIWSRKELCMLPKVKHKHKPSHKCFDLQSCPTRSASVMVSQSL